MLPDSRRWQRRLDPLLDPAVALGVFVLSVLPLANAQGCGCRPVPGWAWGLVVAESLALVFRRRWPFGASLASGLLAFGYGLTSLPDPPISYAGVVALYSVAALSSRRLARIAGVMAALAVALALLNDGSNADLSNVAVNYLVFTTAWLLGDGAWNRRQRELAMEARAEQAERTRDADAARAVVSERNRIAREMHDVVAHHVSMMVVQAEAGPVVVERDPARAIATFDAISATGKAALTEMRELLGVLRQDSDERLAPQPGVERLPALVDSVRATGTDVDLAVSGLPRPLSDAVGLSAYRVLQEALTNAVRHAGPVHISVTITYGPETLHLDVVDDGTFAGSAPQQPAGHGLVAMRERVALVGGTLAVGPQPGGGWAVRAVLPLDRVLTP